LNRGIFKRGGIEKILAGQSRGTCCGKKRQAKEKLFGGGSKKKEPDTRRTSKRKFNKVVRSYSGEDVLGKKQEEVFYVVGLGA